LAPKSLAKSPTLAWHYTPGVHFSSIMRDGFIRGATAHVPENEKPVVWFSLDQFFEPTSKKLFQHDDGTLRKLSMEETHAAYEGLFRFGVPPKHLLSGDNLRRRANIQRESWNALVKSALRDGASPNLWYGSLDAVAVGSCVIERMGPDYAWAPIHLARRAPATA
jgi:hypothetical protein